MKKRLFPRWIKDPLTLRRIQRFKAHRRAHASFIILATLYVLSLGAELLCNDRPLVVRFEGRLLFPMLKYYPESTFVPGGQDTRPRYRALSVSPAFTNTPGNRMIFTPIRYGPQEVISSEDLRDAERATLRLRPAPGAGYVNIDTNGVILRFGNAEPFFGADSAPEGVALDTVWAVPDAIQDGLRIRFANTAAERISAVAEPKSNSVAACEMSLSTYEARSRAPQYVRVTLREAVDENTDLIEIHFDSAMQIVGDPPPDWTSLSTSTRSSLTSFAHANFDLSPPQETRELDGRPYLVSLEKNDISWPHPPTHGHWMGIDNAGRDVLARIIYAFRISVTFGLVLVCFSMLIGMAMGAIQGYYGGVFDMVTQRLIEIWSALPFLYIMILMGSVFGRKFSVLLLCYAAFNWIGISYYMRAEFLRLRRKPFVEAARCMGIPPGKIMRRHILPNAITPAITLFPFGLVGAIYALVSLDYLGFGLMPLTPSWGEMLHQAQNHREAWWLIVYPSASLFLVMLLGVFIGEGIRDAFDPREYSKME